MNQKELIKLVLSENKINFNELIKVNGSELYEGIFEVINKLENNDEFWDNIINEINEDFDDEDENYRNMILVDSVDRLIFNEFKYKFKDNLIKLGYKFDIDDESWDIKNKNNNNEMLICYGVIWDYWIDLDTCVRESIGDIFEEVCIEN